MPTMRRSILFFYTRRLMPLVLVCAATAAGTGTARSDDCSSLRTTCVREQVAVQGKKRQIAVSLFRKDNDIALYNVIVPGTEQLEIAPGGTFWVAVPASGQARYSVQSCFGKNPIQARICNGWQMVTRTLAPVSACENYTDAAAAAVGEADKLGCGFSGDRWKHNSKVHLSACLRIMGEFQSFIDNETRLRSDDLAACQARVAAATKPVDNRPVTKTTGGSGTRAKSGILTCQGGGMAVTIKDQSVFVNFASAGQPANEAPPGPGQCAWSDRVVNDGESHRLAFTRSKAQADGLINAAKSGGAFKVLASSQKAFVIVSEIVAVDTEDEALPPPVEQAEAAPVDDEDPVTSVPSSACPAGEATVSTPEGIHLNVRARPSSEAEIVGQLPDASEVEVTGACAQPAVGFAKGKTLKPKGSKGWCRIEAPAQGCVNAQFLTFGDAPLEPAVGFAKKKTGKKTEPGSGEESFTGNWSALADDIEYRMSMKQNGTSVSGTFRGTDGSKGTITGKLKGKVLRFSWKQSDGNKGSGKFTLTSDGQSFKGSYNFGGSPDKVEGSWNGSRS